MYFDEIAFPRGVGRRIGYEVSLNPEFGLTLARLLNQSCFPAVLQSNQITIKFTTSELGLRSLVLDTEVITF